MEQPTQQRKPKVLYVDRLYRFADQNADTQVVIEVLSQEFDVDFQYTLGPWVLDYVEVACQAEPFDAMVTHVPYNPEDSSRKLERASSLPESIFLRMAYSDSLDILAELRKKTAFPLVAYTGATGMDSILLDYADAVVMKTNDVRADAQAVLANLLALREKYKELQPPPPAPSHANGWTVCEATCHLSSGLGLLAIGAIREEVEKADRAARLAMISPEGVAKEVDCKSAYEVATLFVFEGARLRLSIEGTDDLAERAARRIYGILTSRFACNLRPERFEQAPTPAPGG